MEQELIRKMTNNNNKRAIIRYSKDGKKLSILCYRRHLLEHYVLDSSFGGSMLEARLSFRHEGDRFDRMSEMCQGAGHE